MSTVAEIVAAAARLSADEFLELRRELNRLELRRWEKDLAAPPTAVERAKILDEVADGLGEEEEE